MKKSFYALFTHFIYGVGCSFLLKIVMENILGDTSNVDAYLRGQLFYFLVGGSFGICNSFIQDFAKNTFMRFVMSMGALLIIMNALFVLLGFKTSHLFLNNIIWLVIGIGIYLFSYFMYVLHARTMTKALKKRQQQTK